jgi:redox-sensitive bicupin YhaK (pirin superfamily)
MGNSGYIGPGDVQWMTAGSGIVHEEMPQLSPLGLRGFQLWVNLSAADKMRDPAYSGFRAQEIPVESFRGGEVRVIAGSFGSSRGPVRGLPGDPRLYDLHLGDSGSAEIEVPTAWTVFACVYEGELERPSAPPEAGDIRAPYCALFGDGDKVRFKAAKGGASLIFAAGAPIGESIAWGGPIVMNTQAELDLAFEEYAAGTFVKARSR